MFRPPQKLPDCHQCGEGRCPPQSADCQNTVSRWLVEDIQLWKWSCQLIRFEPVRSLFVTAVVPVNFLMEIIFSITNNLVSVLADHPVRTQAYVSQAGYRVRIQHELLETFRHQGILLLLLMPICKPSSSERPRNKLPLSGEDSATLGEIPDPFLFVMKRRHGQHTPFPSPSGYRLLRAPCENNPDFSILPVQGLGRYICTLS